MRVLYLFLLVAIFSLNTNAQVSTAFKNYLQKVKSPVYLDMQVGLSPLVAYHDLTRFANISGGVQLTRKLGVGVDFIQGQLGGAYDYSPFEGKGLQLRYTTHRWIVKGTFGSIDIANKWDDTFYEYEYIPTKNDRYWRIDAGVRFWKVMALSVSVLSAQNLLFDVFERDYLTNDLIYTNRESDGRKGMTITLGVLLPPFGRKK